jgi:hypothetical protein
MQVSDQGGAIQQCQHTIGIAVRRDRLPDKDDRIAATADIRDGRRECLRIIQSHGAAAIELKVWRRASGCSGSYSSDQRLIVVLRRLIPVMA